MSRRKRRSEEEEEEGLEVEELSGLGKSTMSRLCCRQQVFSGRETEEGEGG